MKKQYITPKINAIELRNEKLLGNAVSWTDPDGNHHDIIPGNPDEGEEDEEDEAKEAQWGDWDYWE